MDLAITTNQPILVPLAGETFAIRPQVLRELGEWQAYFKCVVKHPLLAAAEAIQLADCSGVRLSKEVRDAMLDSAGRAAQAWPPRLGSPHWFAAFDAVEGGWAHLLYLALRPTRPEITEAAAADLWKRATNDEVWMAIGVAIFGEPEVSPQGMNGLELPKAPPPASASQPGGTHPASATTGGRSCTN